MKSEAQLPASPLCNNAFLRKGFAMSNDTFHASAINSILLVIATSCAVLVSGIPQVSAGNGNGNGNGNIGNFNGNGNSGNNNGNNNAGNNNGNYNTGNNNGNNVTGNNTGNGLPPDQKEEEFAVPMQLPLLNDGLPAGIWPTLEGINPPPPLPQFQDLYGLDENGKIDALPEIELY
jgi:hypothetical protein